AEWIEGTFGVWRRLVEPVVTSLAAAITGMLNQQSNDMAGLQPMMEPMMRAASSDMLAAQIGQSIGQLSTDVVSVSDIAIPLT
ncbi:zinc-dependent metalloprotease, partial [Bacillus pumilus]|uniref:zinc-dependent metalloprotease n=1 Tax=Bacillus pumilus TaxID=1408 RepID=UPI0016481270